MDTASLLALTATFYDVAFDVDEAKVRFGDGTEPLQLRPFQLKLASPDPEVEAVWLESVDPVSLQEEPFLTGVIIDRKSPVIVAFPPLVERFGPPREVPRLKPYDPRNYQFAVKGTPIEGYLMLSVELGDDDDVPDKHVVRITLRRIPPDAAAPPSVRA